MEELGTIMMGTWQYVFVPALVHSIKCDSYSI